MKLKLTEAAERDLADLSAWLTAEASESTARRVVAEMLEGFESILTFPHSAAPRDRIRPGLRVVLRHNQAMYYKVEGDLVVVIRVLHSARDVAAIAEAGGFGAGG